jgi:uncharacterized membrane protein
MAERCFSARTLIERSPAEVFAWVSDYRNVPRVLEGVSRWEPLGEEVSGRGARFDVEMQVLGFPLRNVLVLETWDEPRAIGWRSESGLLAQAGGWRFRALAAGTEVTLTIRYLPPGGPFGGLVAGRADGLVRQRLERALARMKAILEHDD